MIKSVVMASLSLFVISIIAIIAFQLYKRKCDQKLIISYTQGGIGLLACLEATVVLLAKFIYV